MYISVLFALALTIARTTLPPLRSIAESGLLRPGHHWSSGWSSEVRDVSAARPPWKYHVLEAEVGMNPLGSDKPSDKRLSSLF